jgi:hypothetical protein
VSIRLEVDIIFEYSIGREGEDSRRRRENILVFLIIGE